MITSYTNGNKIVFKNNQWIYEDIKDSMFNNVKPCKQCNKKPAIEGYDNCLGKLPLVTNACCGHGLNKNAYVQFGKIFIRGKQAIIIQKILKNKGGKK